VLPEYPRMRVCGTTAAAGWGKIAGVGSHDLGPTFQPEVADTPPLVGKPE